MAKSSLDELAWSWGLKGSGGCIASAMLLASQRMTLNDGLMEPTRVQISIHKVLRAGGLSVLQTSGSEAAVSLTPLAFSYAVS